jgi:hypothetical protein
MDALVPAPHNVGMFPLWMIAAGALAFLAAIFYWAGWFEHKDKKRRLPRDESEEFRIDPDSVPEFKPTWRNQR